MISVIKCLFEVVHSRSPWGWTIIDKDYKIIYANQAMCNLWGKTPKQVIDRSLVDLFYDGNRQNQFGEYCGALIKTLETGKELRLAEICLPNSISQENTWYLANTYLFKDPDQRNAYAAGSYCVIDKFKDTEEKLQCINLSIIKAFCRAMGTRDAYTVQHEEKVAELLLGFTSYMKYPEREIKKIYLTGIVHDIGKIAIPEAIINNPGRLTAAEFEIIKQHSEIGAEILYEIEGFEEVAKIVRHHHERFDGSGYPDGLTGNEIPLYSRVVAVCDAFDAMTRVRCYRNKPLSIDNALLEIEKCAETQFDPIICEQFIKYIQQKGKCIESA